LELSQKKIITPPATFFWPKWMCANRESATRPEYFQFERNGVSADGGAKRAGSGGGIRWRFVEPFQCGAQLGARFFVGIDSGDQSSHEDR